MATPRDESDAQAEASDSGFDRLLARVAATDPAPSSLRVPSSAGRYEVGRRLGRGGLGIVHAGWDPQLRREVALKFVRPDRIGGESGKSLVERLRREAQILAQLDHPSVVRVFDIGEAEGQLYIAMELLDGPTLRMWAREQRSSRAIADACIQVARGIAAAHASGVIHRDVKPDNVIVVARSNRVVVVDFGLADPNAAFSNDVTARPGSDEHTSSERLTRDGAVMGTHGYLAPELAHGVGASAASDQYAWCVTCNELVFGTKSIRRGGERSGSIPAALRRVLRRGTAEAPNERHATMQELIADAERSLAAPRTRTKAVLVAAAAGLAVAAGWHTLAERRQISVCEADGAAIESIWNDDARTAVRASLLATGLDYAASTVDRVLPRLDERAEAWRRTRTQACLDGSIREAFDEDTLDRAVWCLEEHRIDLEAVVATLSHADRIVLERAIDLSAGLPDVELCRDASLLTASGPASDPTQRGELLEVRTELAHAFTLGATGKHEAAAATAEACVERAVALEWPPLEAAARLELGRALAKTGDRERANVELEAAYFGAERVGAWGVAARAAISLCATSVGELERAVRWSNAAEIALAQLPVDERLAEGDRAAAAAYAHRARGDLERAQALFAQAADHAERVFGPEHPKTAIAVRNLASVMHERGDVMEARALLERSLALFERTMGPDHPHTAAALANLAVSFVAAGDYARAKPMQERALVLRERAFGREHPEIAIGLNNLANIYSGLGEPERAAELMRRAIALQERLLGRDHAEVAGMTYNLGNIYLRIRDYGRALTMHERALVSREQALGPYHPDTALSLGGVAMAHTGLGHVDDGRRRFRESIVAFERSVGPDAPALAEPLHGLAVLELDGGQAAIALPLARRALESSRRGEEDPARAAEIEFTVARAMWEAGDDRSAARQHAEHARDVLADAAEVWSGVRTELDDWLGAHPE